jgi:3-phosphoshikimate 1-carboxyvinyltransferase
MNTLVMPSALKGEIRAIASKSFVHRAMIASALSASPSMIVGRITGKDVEATARCLTALGARMEAGEGFLRVAPIFSQKILDLDRGESGSILPVLDCGESGSTLRFILPVAAAIGAACTVTGSKRLGQRPIAELLAALAEHGAGITGDSLPFSLRGRLTPGIFRIRAEVSSQYITGLLLALPVLSDDSEILSEGEPVSAPYIDITLDVLRRYGAEIAKKPNGFLVKGISAYRAPEKTEAEGDWSNAAFFLTAGAVCGEVTVSGLSLESRQGDKAIAAILKKMGADVRICGNSVTVKSAPLCGMDIDARDIPDLVPILSVAALHAEGITRFYGAARLKDKESDRLTGIIQMITALGGEAGYRDDCLIIKKSTATGEVILHANNDHRMAMSAAVAASCHNGKIIIEGSECVEKSYPDFFEDFNKLGGKADVVLS